MKKWDGVQGAGYKGGAATRFGWRRDRRGASGVVVTLLILLVAAGALSMFMGIYVPIWGKDTEAQQMKKIQTQMLGLKQNIDLQILAGKSSTFTTRLTIGDDGGPLFHLTRAPGAVQLRPDGGLYLVSNTSDRNDSQGIARGFLEYSSFNQYYVDQTYHYENGALIVVQGGRTVMKAGPHFDVRREQDGNVTAEITLISLNGVSAIREGTGDIIVESTLNIYDVTTYSGGAWTQGKAVSIYITTKYPAVWAELFNATLKRSEVGLVEGTDFQVTYSAGAVNATLLSLNRLDLGIAIVDIQMGT